MSIPPLVHLGTCALAINQIEHLMGRPAVPLLYGEPGARLGVCVCLPQNALLAPTSSGWAWPRRHQLSRPSTPVAVLIRLGVSCPGAHLPRSTSSRWISRRQVWRQARWDCPQLCSLHSERCPRPAFHLVVCDV